MKKKYREITVGGIIYTWVLNFNCDGDGGNLLKVFLNKKVVYEEIIGGGISITPKLVSELIKKHIK